MFFKFIVAVCFDLLIGFGIYYYILYAESKKDTEINVVVRYYRALFVLYFYYTTFPRALDFIVSVFK